MLANGWQWQTPSHAGSIPEHSHGKSTTKTITPHIERAIAERYGHSHSLALPSTHRAIEPLRSHAPGGARCVAVLRGWPYPTTPFPPPQPGHTPLACRGSRRPGGGRGGRLVRRGVVERERGLPIPCPAGPVDCPRVRCGLGEPAVVVGAQSRAAHRLFRCALPSPTHPPAARFTSFTGSKGGDASGGYVMCSHQSQFLG